MHVYIYIYIDYQKYIYIYIYIYTCIYSTSPPPEGCDIWSILAWNTACFSSEYSSCNNSCRIKSLLLFPHSGEECRVNVFFLKHDGKRKRLCPGLEIESAIRFTMMITL